MVEKALYKHYKITWVSQQVYQKVSTSDKSVTCINGDKSKQHFCVYWAWLLSETKECLFTMLSMKYLGILFSKISCRCVQTTDKPEKKHTIVVINTRFTLACQTQASVDIGSGYCVQHQILLGVMLCVNVVRKIFMHSKYNIV